MAKTLCLLNVAIILCRLFQNLKCADLAKYCSMLYLKYNVHCNCGHRELIIYPNDPNGETLVFDSLFCISQHTWGITICLKFKPKHE